MLLNVVAIMEKQKEKGKKGLDRLQTQSLEAYCLPPSLQNSAQQFLYSQAASPRSCNVHDSAAFSPFVPISIFHSSPVDRSFSGPSRRRQGSRSSHIWGRAAFPWLMCPTAAIGQGIKFSILQQKLSVLPLSHLKNKNP